MVMAGLTALSFSACTGEKITTENNRTKISTFFMALLFSPSGLK
jgi:hypothetical protein